MVNVEDRAFCMKKIFNQRTSAWSMIISAVGIILSPAMVGAVSDNANTTVSATVDDTISISTGSTVSFSITPTSGGVVSSSSDTVTVSTNRNAGYNLTVADADATTTLVSGGDTFTASSGTKTVPVTLTNGSWGFAVATGTPGIGTNGFDASYTTETNNASSTSKWAGMPATGSPMMIKTTSSTATNDTTTVWYAAKANTSQPGGTYTDSVTYTATTN